MRLRRANGDEIPRADLFTWRRMKREGNGAFPWWWESSFLPFSKTASLAPGVVTQGQRAGIFPIVQRVERNVLQRETNTPWREAHRYALAQLHLFLFLPRQVLCALRQATTPQLGLAAGAGRWLCCFFHFCRQMWRVPRAPRPLSVKLLHGLAEVISVKVGQDGEPGEEGEAEGGERLDVGHRWMQ